MPPQSSCCDTLELGITEVAEHRQIPRVAGEEKMLAENPVKFK